MATGQVPVGSTGDSSAGWDFFVSYTQADRAWAEWIAWQLEEAGYRVLIQAWDFVPGTNWLASMQQGVIHSERTIAVLSTAYLDSVYGQQEWQAAQGSDPQGFERKLVPIRVVDCVRPGLLNQVVSFDLFGLEVEAARDRLLEQVRALLAGRAKPARPPGFPGSPHTAATTTTPPGTDTHPRPSHRSRPPTPAS